MNELQIERIGEIYNETKFLAIRIPSGRTMRDQYIRSMACMMVARDVLIENGLNDEMEKRLDLLADIANNEKCEDKQ